MRRDDDKIRVQIDSTVGDFKAIIDVLEGWLVDAPQQGSMRIKVATFRNMLQQQVMKD